MIKNNVFSKKMLSLSLAVIIAITTVMTTFSFCAINVRAATMPGITSVSTGNRGVSSIKISFTVKNPSKLKITQSGIYISKSKTSGFKKAGYDKDNSTKTSLSKYFVVGEKLEANYKLSENTTYYYYAYCIYNNKTYKSSTYKFTTQKYSTQCNAFINDSRWKHNSSWGPNQKCKFAAQTTAKGCCAYALDFAAYVCGKNRSGTDKCISTYASVSSIKSGDILELNGHWIVVTSRSGNTLKTAEGNMSKKVRIGSYTISGKTISNKYNKYTFKKGYRFM